MKLLAAVVVLGVMAAYVSGEAHTCGVLDKVVVRRQWATAFGEGNHRLEFGLHVFNNFFKTFPKAREMFTKFRGDNVYSPEFQAHSQRILSALGMLIATSDDTEALKVLLASVKANLSEKGIKTEFYEAFRDELLATLPEYLETHLDWDAWTACLNAIIDNLK